MKHQRIPQNRRLIEEKIALNGKPSGIDKGLVFKYGEEEGLQNGKIAF